MKTKGMLYCILYAFSLFSLLFVFYGIINEINEIKFETYDSLVSATEKNKDNLNSKNEDTLTKNIKIAAINTKDICYNNIENVFDFKIYPNSNKISNNFIKHNYCNVFSYAGIIFLSLIYNTIIHNKKFMKIGTL